MTSKELTKLSKFISLILRHKPEVINITLDSHGWANTKDLIKGINGSGKHHITMSILEEIVATDEKQRYSFNREKTKIRANQGHSIPVDLSLIPTLPPDILYHGTSTRIASTILTQGLKPMSRQYVHLSKDINTAIQVGKRHGEPVVLFIDTAQMYKDGFEFYLSENKVWLTNDVPAKYIIDNNIILND